MRVKNLWAVFLFSRSSLIIIIIVYLHIVIYKSRVLIIFTAIVMPCLLIPCYDMSVANEARRPVPNGVLLPCITPYLYIFVPSNNNDKVHNYKYEQSFN